MSLDPVASVIIPLCNQAGYTRICLDYLKANAGDALELVIVDNASRDDTRELVMSRESDFRVVYLRNDRNMGPIAALNQGLGAAACDIVCAMHNDLVIFEKNWLVKLAALIRERNDIGLVGLAGRKKVDKRGVVDEQSLAHHLINEDLNAPMTAPWEEVAVLDGVLMAGRKEVFRRVNGFSEIYGLMHFYDMDISLKAMEAGYKNAVINLESLHINNGGITRKTKAYKDLVPDDLKLYNANSKIYFKRWQKAFPIEIK